MNILNNQVICKQFQIYLLHTVKLKNKYNPELCWTIVDLLGVNIRNSISMRSIVVLCSRWVEPVSTAQIQCNGVKSMLKYFLSAPENGTQQVTNSKQSLVQFKVQCTWHCWGHTLHKVISMALV